MVRNQFTDRFTDDAGEIGSKYEGSRVLGVVWGVM
jgi:hypothetical protein